MGKYFGTDGFRGEANKVLTADHAYKIGRYLGWYYNQNHRGRIIIGKDTRRSSYMFEYALVAGITASGADAFLLHVTTTPSVAYVVRQKISTVALWFLPVTIHIRQWNQGHGWKRTQDFGRGGSCTGEIHRW